MAESRFSSSYDHKLSPTLKQWAKLSIYDTINKIKPVRGFEDKQLFHFENIPIKWIALSGVIIAISEKDYKYILTLDDGSGETIDIHFDKTRSALTNYNPSPDLQNYKEGDVVMVKGTVKIVGFNGSRQLILRRIVRLENMVAELWFLREVNKWKVLTRKSTMINERMDFVEQIERIMGELWTKRKARLRGRYIKKLNDD